LSAKVNFLPEKPVFPRRTGRVTRLNGCVIIIHAYFGPAVLHFADYLFPLLDPLLIQSRLPEAFSYEDHSPVQRKWRKIGLDPCRFGWRSEKFKRVDS
jgi:hypothetical protein